MNRITLTGRLTRDPELRETSDGTAVCQIRLAVDGLGRGNQAGFISVAQFGPGGKAAAETLSKGWLVAVDGRLEQHDWTPEDSDRKVTETAVVGRIEFLTAPHSKPEAETTPEPVAA